MTGDDATPEERTSPPLNARERLIAKHPQAAELLEQARRRVAAERLLEALGIDPQDDEEDW